MPTAYHMVHYRRFEASLQRPRAVTLEGLCREALSSASGAGVALWERAPDRLFDLGDDNGSQIILNRVADQGSAVFGEMCLVHSRGFQALLQLDASKVQLSNLTFAEIYELQERAAPKGSQFLRGLVYWLAIGDHLFFVKTQSMTVDLMRQYLDWLLKSGGSVLGSADTFAIEAEFDKTLSAGDLGDISNMRVTSTSGTTLRVVPDDDAGPANAAHGDRGGDRTVATKRTIADRTLYSERANKVAEALLGPEQARSLAETLGPGEYISADASVAVRGRRTEASKAKMKELANRLADESDDKVQIEGKDGKVVDGDAILRTRMPFMVPHDGSSLLEFDNVADQLREVYSRFVRDEKITA